MSRVGAPPGDSLKLVIVTPYYAPHIGGVENYARHLAVAMRLRGWDVVVITTHEGRRRLVSEQIDGLTVHRLPTLCKISYTPVHPAWPVMMRRLLRHERPDVINVHTPVPGIADVASACAGEARVVVSQHAASLRKPDRAAFNLMASLYLRLEKRMLRRADLALPVSDFVAEALTDLPDDKIRVLANAVDRDRVQTGEVVRRRRRLIFIGQLNPTHSWKGLYLIIEALALYVSDYDRDIELVVVGDGTARVEYEDLSARLGVEAHVRFVGSLVGEDKFELLRSSSVLVAYPTTDNDAFPTVFLEAWASGCAVLTAAIGPIPSLVEHLATGYVVELHSPARLAEGMRRLLDDEHLVRDLANRALAHVAANYTWDVVASTLDAELRTLLARPRAGHV